MDKNKELFVPEWLISSDKLNSSEKNLGNISLILKR